jgi:hypothetical protein
MPVRGPVPDPVKGWKLGSRLKKTVVWIATGGVAVASVAYRLPQPPGYHSFADQRMVSGIPNFTNVGSNAAFAIVGVSALVGLCGKKGGAAAGNDRRREMAPFLVFYLAAVGVAAGSVLYHYAPSNLTLFWDRLPMALCVAALASGLLAGRLGVEAGGWAFRVLGLMIPVTVVYWRRSEMSGAGNVWPYLCWMYGALLVTALIMLLYEPRHTTSVHEWVALLLFAGAMLFDTLLDHWFYSLVGFMGGHALKHLLAASGMFWLWWFSLRQRVPLDPTALGR